MRRKRIHLFIGEPAGVDKNRFFVCPTDIGEQSGVVIDDVGGFLLLEEGVDGCKVVDCEGLGSFLENEVGGGEVYGVFDAEFVDEAGGEGAGGWFEVECEEGGLFKEMVIGEFVAGECSVEFAPFFLLVAGFCEPGSWHVFEELEGVLSVFGKKDVRLAALGLEMVFLLKVGGGFEAFIGKTEIVMGVQPGDIKSPGGFFTEEIGACKEEEATEVTCNFPHNEPGVGSVL